MNRLFVSLLVLLLLGCGSDWQRAEKDAKEYASNVPHATGKVACTKQDTDGDGYCACTVFMKRGDVLPIECGCKKYGIWCPEGCKQVDNYKATGRRPGRRDRTP